MKAEAKLPVQVDIPDEQTLSLYRARAAASIEKARRLLGYEPKFDFEQGMNVTAQFVAWADL